MGTWELKFNRASDLSLFVIKTSNMCFKFECCGIHLVIFVCRMPSSSSSSLLFLLLLSFVRFRWIKMETVVCALFFSWCLSVSVTPDYLFGFVIHNRKTHKSYTYSACAFHFRLRGHSIANDHVWYCPIFNVNEQHRIEQHKHHQHQTQSVSSNFVYMLCVCVCVSYFYWVNI